MLARARRRRLIGAGAIIASSALAVAGIQSAATAAKVAANPVLGNFTNVVVIYEENHSFDNLYGNWGTVRGVPVEGQDQATGATITQVDQNGLAYGCLLQDDVNLTTPPLTSKCRQTTSTGVAVNSHFVNQPFNINDYISSTATTCAAPGTSAPVNGVKVGTGVAGGCTRDLVHRFYQEQYQIDGGKQDRYVTGSDAMGLSMGYYDTTQDPVWKYLHTSGSPKYVVADHFFQGAFGGSFLNHQYLVAAQAPTYTCLDTSDVCANPANDLHSVVDTNGMPNTYGLYTATTAVKDQALTQACGLATTDAAVQCGDYAVNTIQPASQPYAPGTPLYKRLQVDDSTSAKNIGDTLTASGVSWNWYSGGWDNAAGITTGAGWTNGDGSTGTCTDPNAIQGNYPYCPDKLFQFHHQPLNYFSNYAEGGPGRSHLQDEADFVAAAQNGTLPQVSFVKPVGEENEHPGYASTDNGEQHLVDLIQKISSGPQGKNTLIVVTYDEFGGQWDHVPVPNAATAPAGSTDAFGPGTRVPALLVSPGFKHSGVAKATFDTTSILATIERGFNVPALSTRDASVSDLRSAVNAGGITLPNG